MKSFKKIIPYAVATLLFVPATSCVSDLDKGGEPIDPNLDTPANTLTSIDSYNQILAKCYSGLAVSSPDGSSGTPDISGIDGGFGQYLRALYNLQELPTDEAVIGWNDQTLKDLHGLQWTSSDVFVNAAYYRINYQISMCNEVMRQIDASGMSEESLMKQYRAEARALRAFSYLHAIDMFGSVPFTDETTGVGGDNPTQITRTDLYTWLENELTELAADSNLPASPEKYRAGKGFVYTMLAKLYLNAKVYIGTEKYTECITACQQAMAQGYTLEENYVKLFNADNDKRTNEIIFALPVDPTHEVSWGSTTYVICGEVSNTSADQVPADYGVTTGWGMFRCRGELPAKFTDGDADGRYKFFTTNQSQYIDDVTDQTNGYFVEKWTNLTDAGEAASNTASDGCATDWPMFRLADVYLMYAEAVLRGGAGGDRSTALGYVNKLRERAYGGSDGDITDGQLTTSFILDERARELYWEGVRRTDLVRYDSFSTSSYLWQWKGGAKDGTSVDSKYNIYPIPTTELTANPNLYNENY